MPLIELKQVNVYLTGREEPLLRDLNLALRAGEWVAAVGRNGCGKSVLGKLIAGLEGRYSGDIHRKEEHGTAVGLVMQNPESQLVGETVWEDICFGLENLGLPQELVRERAAHAVQRTGLAGLESRQVHRMSGGQKQLLALAGSIALNPSVLVADEVTSMLDPASRMKVIRVLQELHRDGVAILMVTQLLEEVAYADRVIALDNGTLVYEGSKELFFYNGHDGGESVCEKIGLEPPYTVQAAKALSKQGVPLGGAYPILPEELVKAVGNR